MNRIYRTLWSAATQSWQAVPETAKSAGKKNVKSSAGGVVASVALSFALNGGASAQAPPAINQLPTGGNVVRGTATISQTATAQAAAMTVNQSSQRAAINWNSFNLGSAASINFVQPNAQAVTLNRVNDSNPSQIFGRITANGQVFVSNANGVYFAPGSSVDVGAITATTHSISDDNFMSGNYVFERNGATGKVVNEGHITTALGGYVALLAPEVQNAGVVVAQAGTVVMAAGEMITLKVDGNNSLASITTTPSAIASLIENKHAVLAPDGQIILSAVALNKLQAGVIKNSGRLEVNSLVSKGGKIYLEGDDITLSSTSTLEAKGALGGGTVLVGGDWQGSGDMRQATKVTMEAGATIDASATDKGDGGKVVLWSDVHNAESVTQVHGSIKAEAGANGGDGGQVETSGHHLKVNDIQVSTKSLAGNAGEWLLDPTNFTIASSSGDMTGAELSNLLISNNITIQSGTGTNTSTKYYGSVGTAGDININDSISWSTNTALTLSASNNIYITAPVIATGSSAGLNLFYGGSDSNTPPTAGTFYKFDLTTPSNSFISMTSSTASLKIGNRSYTLLQSISDIQGMSTSGTYALGQGLSTPGAYNNAVYIGNFTGIFDGLGNAVSGIQLNNNCISNCNIGFFAQASGGAQIKNLLLNEIFTLSGPSSGSATYSNYAVGGLVGRVTGGTLTTPNVFSGIGVTFVQNTKNVSSLSINGYWGGGLIGQTYGASAVYSQVSQSYASLNFDNTAVSSISGSSIGGILGDASASVTSSATGTGGQVNISTTYVSGRLNVKQSSTGYWGVGGLIGQAYGTPVIANNSYTYFEAGSLKSTAGTVSVGGLMGWAQTLTLSNSYSTYGSATSDTSNHIYSGVSLTGNTSLLSGLNSNDWKITNGAIVLRYLPTPSSAPGVPIFVLETETTGVYGNLSLNYSLVDASMSTLTLGSGTYANLGIAGQATYNINNTTDAGTYSIKYLSGLSLSGTAASGYSLYAYPRNYVIDKAPLKVFANNDAKFQGQSDSNGYAGVSYSGFVNGQSSSVLGGNLQITRSINGPDGNLTASNDSVGTYTGALMPSGLTSNNYIITNVAGNYSVIPPNQLLVHVTNPLRTYGSSPTYAPSSIEYYDNSTSAVVNVDLANNVSLNGNVVTVSDGHGGSLQFSLGLRLQSNGQAASYSSSQSLKVGAYQLTATDISNSSTFNNSPNVIGNVTVTPVGLTPSLVQGPSKTYDGTANINVNSLNVAFGGLVTNDSVNLNGTGSFASKNIGTGNVSYILSGLTLSGSDAANYYIPTNNTKLTGTNGTITPTTLGISATAIYSGSTTVTPTSALSTGLVGEDASATVSSLVVNDKNVSAANLVKSLTLSNGAQGNYVLNSLVDSNPGTNTTNTISLSRANLGVSLTATYSGTTSVTPSTTSLTGLVGVDAGATANSIVLSSKDVGSGNRVTSLALSTGNEANYQLNTSTNTTLSTNTTNTATLNAKSLTVSGLTAPTTRIYDGTTSTVVSGTPAIPSSEATGTGTTTDGKPYTGDIISLNGTPTGSYNTKNINATTITFAGLTSSNSNYTLSFGTQAGSITAKSLTVSGLTAPATRTYDGTRVAVVSGTAAVTSEAVGAGTTSDGKAYTGDVISFNGTATGTYDIKDVGATSINFGGLTSSNSNYTLSFGTQAGSITAKSLSISGLTAPSSRTYDATRIAAVSGTPTVLTEAVGSGTASDGKAYIGDAISFNSTATGTYDTKDVGATTITFGGLTSGNSNYTLSFGTQAGSITPKTLTVTGLTAPTSRIYNGTRSAVVTGTPTLLATETVGAGLTTDGMPYAGDTITFNGTAIGTYNTKDVGATTITFGGLTSSNNNYTLALGTQTGSISKANLSKVTAAKVYDGLNTVNYSEVIAIEGINNETFTTSAGTAIVSDKNVATLSKTLTNLSGLTLGSTNGGLASNYNLNTGLPAAGSNNLVTISQRALTLTAASETKTYDGSTSSSGTVAVTNKATTDTVSATQSFASKDAAGIGLSTLQVNAGYTIVDGTNVDMSGNYAVTTQTATGTISKANLSKITATKVYDGLSTVTAAQITAIEGVNNETFTASAGTATISNKNVAVGNKTVTDLSGLTLVGGSNTMLASNYNLGTGLPAAGSNNEVTISQRALTLAAVTDSKTYDGSTSSSGTVTVTNKASTDTVSATQSFTSKDVAGAAQSTLQVNTGYTIIDGASADMSSNYVVATQTAAGTINKANLSKVTASKVYDGLSTVTAAQITAIEGVNNETFTASAGTATISDKNVATVNKTLTSLSGLTLVGGSNTMLASNYNLGTGLPAAGSNNDVTISQRALTLAAASETKTYDGSTSSSGTVAVTNKASTDTVSATQSFASKDAAGIGLSTLQVNTGYTIVDGTNVDMSGNYAVTTQTATGTINKANLSKVTAAKPYDGLSTVVAAQVTAIEGVNNETFTASAGTATISDKNVTASNKTLTDLSGLTLSSANGGLRSNYNLNTGLPVAGSNNQVAISAIDLQVTGVSAANKVYDATRNATLTGSATVAGISGDDVSATGTGVGLFANKHVDTSKPVTVTGYTLAGTDAGNYNVLQPVGVSADITQAPLTIRGITAQNKVYDGGTTATVSTANVTKAGLFVNDVVNVAATGSFANKTVANGKTVTLSSSYSGADAGNYLITDQAITTADITAKALGLTIPGASRVYDGSTVISPSGPVTLSGIVGLDQVNLGLGNVTGYVDKNVGTNKTVTYAGLALSGSDAGNYTLPVNPTSNANITPAALTISGITAADKTYDAGTTATVSTSNVTKAGLIGNDVVNVAATGSFADKNVGLGKTVNLSSSYSGADAGNYLITDQATATAEITRANLQITGVTAFSKIYDATRTATLAGTATAVGLGSDVVSATGTGVGTFADKNVGTAKPVTVTGYTLTGTDAGNYTALQPVGVTADITAKPVTAMSMIASSKVYDGTTTASLSGGVLVGVIATDASNVALTQSGAFADKNVGTGKTVTVNNAIAGAEAGNYSLTQASTMLSADITAKALTVANTSVANKVYDGTTTATLSGGVLVGVITADTNNVTLTQSGAFANKDAGTAKAVNITSTLAGTEANNYSLTQPTGLTADISKAPLTVTAENAAKIFGDVNPVLTAKVSGFVGGETLTTSGVTGSPLATTTATATTPFGTAVISAAAGNLSATNYEFSNLVNGTLTIQAIASLNNNEVAALIGSRLNTLSAAQMGSFSISQLTVFSPQQLTTLTPSQIAGMTAEQINAMSPAQMSGLSPAQINALTLDPSVSLNTAQLAVLSPAQVGAISPVQISRMTVTELKSLTEIQLQAFSTAQIAAIAAENFDVFTSSQILSMLIPQEVQSLTSVQLTSFKPSEVASLHAAELAYLDALHRATAGKAFEAPIPVMTEVAVVKPPVASLEVASIKPSPTAPSQAIVTAEAPARTGVLAVTILNSTDTKPLSAGVAYEQVADTVSLRATAAPAVPPLSDKVVFTDKLTTFMVAATNGEMVEFQGSLVNNRMVIVAPSLVAKRVARSEMNLVLAAAVTSLGKVNRVMLANLEGVVLDLR